MKLNDNMKVKKTNQNKNFTVDVGDIKFGDKKIILIGGPCSVESKNQILEISESVKNSGASILRGGAFKPRTSPYSFQGLEIDGIKLLNEAKKINNIPVVTEIMSANMIESFIKEDVDIIQVGARNMQNFDLLKELGKIDKPILLKRGLSATIEEFLHSAEYIMAGGNENVILCERGIRTFETYTRNTLDISSVPILKNLTHLPVIVDPSHACGISSLVEPLSLASVASGADGLIIEVHNNPSEALCDGEQSLNLHEFENLVQKIKSVAIAVGREV